MQKLWKTLIIINVSVIYFVIIPSTYKEYIILKC